MTLEIVIAGLLLAAGVALGIHGARRRGRRWGDAALWLQPLAALALVLLLLPPRLPLPADTLIVFMPSAAPGWTELLRLRPAVALPGVHNAADLDEAPDIATTLRRHPQTRVLDVRGEGLSPRDRDAVSAGTRGLRFTPAPEHGLLELRLPARTLLGTQWSVSGRVAKAVAQLELHDPSGAVVDSLRPDPQGRFTLSATARAVGPARFELRLLDAKSAVTETAAVPVVAEAGTPLRAILRVGAPDAEFKYWRRWAADAGIALALRAGLSEKIDLREGESALTPTTLAQTDLVVVDERAWSTLDAAEKAALVTAVRDGLGLLLKVAGPVDATVAADWSALGVTVQPAESHGVTLDHRTGLRDRSGFTVAPVRVDLADGAPLLRADEGEMLAQWRGEGRGRIGTWTLLDSYQLALQGEAARYGALWAQVLATLSRPQPRPAELQVPVENWVDERLEVCGLDRTAAAVAPDQARVELIVDGHGCAGLWPEQAGWYATQSAGTSTPFYVRATDDAASLRAARDRRETQRLVRDPAVDASSPSTVQRTLPRAPLLLLWLLVTAVLWWRERPDH